MYVDGQTLYVNIYSVTSMVGGVSGGVFCIPSGVLVQWVGP